VAYVMGGVFSHKEGFTTVVQVLPPLAFHAVISALGLFCIVRSLPKKA
jgi:hypothetical protein